MATVELKIDDEPVNESLREEIDRAQAQHEAEREHIDEKKLKELQQHDKGGNTNLLAADRSGTFARLVHRNSFFVTDTSKQAFEQGQD
jgi:hypothetical protein